MKKTLFVSLIALTLFAACKDDDAGGADPQKGIDLTGTPYDPAPYDLTIPPGFPAISSPVDNPITSQGVELGRMLFFDPILSLDSTISCSSCHDPAPAFTDRRATSLGVNGQTGRRSSMSLINIGFLINGFFWDGRSPTLEEQALHPVEDPVEMAEIWDDVEVKIQRHDRYPIEFRKAFGIGNSTEITRNMITKAIAQYERTLVSANSRFDKKFYQLDTNPSLLSDEEVDGWGLFFDQPGFSDAHCAHCHDGQALLTSDVYANNGIEEVATLNDFPDLGLGGVTDKLSDNGKFRAPSLRNIELTAPYMHDGRFQTLEEVVEHYSSGGHPAANVLVESIQPLNLTEHEKTSLVAFLKTFTDTSYLSNPHFKSPFE